MDKFKPKTQLPAKVVQLFNLWANSSVIPCEFEGNNYQFSLGPATGGFSWATLGYKWANQDLKFRLFDQSFLKFLDPQLEQITWTSCEPDLQNCLLNAFHEHLAQLLNQLNAGPVSPDLAIMEPFDLRNGLAALTLQGPNGSCFLQMSQEDGCFSFLKKACMAITDKAYFDVTSLPFVFRMERGGTRLRIEELRQLRAGDILLTQEHDKVRSQLIRFHFHAYTFWAKPRAENTFETQTALMDETNELPAGIIPEDETPVPGSDTNETPPAEAGPAEEAAEQDASQQTTFNTDALPVHVTFDVGEKVFSLHDLQNIHVGYTFETDHSVEDPVKIRANGKIIGEGEWVQINEHFGVRITQLN